jgi:hypothetical protein
MIDIKKLSSAIAALNEEMAKKDFHMPMLKRTRK